MIEILFKAKFMYEEDDRIIILGPLLRKIELKTKIISELNTKCTTKKFKKVSPE